MSCHGGLYLVQCLQSMTRQICFQQNQFPQHFPPEHKLQTNLFEFQKMKKSDECYMSVYIWFLLLSIYANIFSFSFHFQITAAWLMQVMATCKRESLGRSEVRMTEIFQKFLRKCNFPPFNIFLWTLDSWAQMLRVVQSLS